MHIRSSCPILLAVALLGCDQASERAATTTAASPARPAGAHWATAASLPVARAEIGVAELGGRIFVVGGTEGDGKNPTSWATKTVSIFDPAQNSWSSAAPLPSGLSHAGVAALGGRLYAVGGFTKPIHLGPQRLAFVYDPVANRWSALPPIAPARGSVAVAAVDGKLHVFGGRTSDRVVKQPSAPGQPQLSAGFGTITLHQIYDPATGRWSQGPSIPGPARDHMGIAVVGDEVHLFGGRVADVVDNLDRHDIYNARTGRWRTAAPLPRPRSSGAYTVLDGRILYAGGECKPGGQPFTRNVFADVTAYDPVTDRWSNLAALPQARHAFGAATLGQRAYFIAGADLCGGGSSTDVQTLTLPG